MSTVVSIIDDMGNNQLHSFESYDKAFEFIVVYHGVEDYVDMKKIDGYSDVELEEDVFYHINQEISDNNICSGGFELIVS